MCVYIAIIATIVQLMLWRMDSAPALKCNDYRLESRIARQLEKSKCTLEREVWYVNIWHSVHWEEVPHSVGECTLKGKFF